MSILRTIFRHYRARARLRAHKARGEAVLRAMREDWKPSHRWECRHIFEYDGGKKQTVAWTIIVGETNAIEGRRVRVVSQPSAEAEKYYNARIENTAAWLRSKRWESGADGEDVEDIIC